MVWYVFIFCMKFNKDYYIVTCNKVYKYITISTIPLCEYNVDKLQKIYHFFCHYSFNKSPFT